MSEESLHILMVLIPALPLISAVLTAMLGPKVLRSQSHWPTIAAIGTSFVLATILLMDVVHLSTETGGEMTGWATMVDLWQWVDVTDALGDGSAAASGAPFQILVTLRADTLTCIMLAMVTFVASLVAIYAAGYMHDDPGYWRFFAYVSLFVFSMTMLVSVSNFVLLYVFWEAVGLCSYLLIGFWYEKPEASAAGMKAFLVNRVGDFGFALALFLIWVTYGTLNYHDTLAETGQAVAYGTAEAGEAVRYGVLGQARLSGDVGDATFATGGVALAICLLLMLGACGKSAQFPLHVWLPDAMEGPTPVSALIHAATMVTAGVYMVTRCAPLFLADERALLVVSVVGGFTALFAALIAFTQTDLKRILAYSTISQLGYMFLALGTGTLAGFVAGMFHLFTHAFFKALLFLGAGSVMHAMGGVIDVRRFGGLRRIMPITHWTFLAGCLALSGIFPFSGFHSKDSVLLAVYSQGDHGVYAQWFEWLFYAAVFTAFLTAMYTFRAFFLTFYGDEEVPPEAGHHAHESPSSMTGPLIVLAVCALVVGFLFMGAFPKYLAETPSLAIDALAGEAEAHGEHAHGAHRMIALLSSAVAVLGIGLAAFFYLGDRREIDAIRRGVKPLYGLSHGKFFIDEIYNLLIVKPGLILARLFAWLDRFFVDGLVNLAGKVPLAAGSVLRYFQSGLVPYYAMLMVLGLLVLLGSMYVR